MRAFVPMQISSKVFQFAIALGLVSSTAATASAQFQRSGAQTVSCAYGAAVLQAV